MASKRSKSILRLVSFIVLPSYALFGVLCGIAAFVVARYPEAGWNTMVAIFAITAVFSISLAILLFFITRPWRKDFRFYSKEDEVDEIMVKLTESNELITRTLGEIEARLEHIEKNRRTGKKK